MGDNFLNRDGMGVLEMKKITSGEHFMAQSASVFEEIVSVLSTKMGVRLVSVSAPQSVACYQVSDIERQVQLRLVLIPLANGHLLGRVSWLDWRGVDHVCCYINESLDCLVMAPNGCWEKQKKSPELLCIQGFESLVA
jgi:hypothetical protein